MLNCSYNLGMRRLKAFIPAYPVGRAEDVAGMMAEFVPVARAVIGVANLKIITFGPRPQDFFACNAPIKGLYELGVEVEENSELDLLVAYKAHADDQRIPAVCEDMAKEMGEGCYYPDLSRRMAQLELTLLDWAEEHRGSRKYVAFADKCWPAFPRNSALSRATSIPAWPPGASPWPARWIFTAPCPSTSAPASPATP
jgi:L-fucose isomerase-like protein